MDMKKIMPTFFASLLLFCIHSTYIFAQSPAPAPALPAPSPPAPAPPAPAPPAPVLLAPTPSGPPDITTILQKAGRFTKFIRLLKSTDSVDRINTQLRKSNQGLTIFAPNDGAFSSLKSGSLNSYTDEQQTELVQFHILTNFVPLTQFDTLSNPLSTQAGATDYGQFPLNVTTSGTQVNLTTGFANASVSSTVYTNSQLAVYEVDHVLLPQKFFVAPPPSPPPAPAPAPSKPKKAQSSDASTRPVDSSDAVSLIHGTLFQASYVFAVLGATLLFG